MHTNNQNSAVGGNLSVGIVKMKNQNIPKLHVSILLLYSYDPINNSGARYHNVTTRFV